MKRPIAILLLISLLGPANIIAESPGSPRSSGNDYGIDLRKTYTGAEVLALIDTVLAEADVSISDAYAEGYKAGLKEAAGNAAYYKSLSESANVPWWSPVVSGLGGLAIGYLTGSHARW